MKQFLVLISMITIGGIAAPYHPFWGLLLYYTFAVLRPQVIWSWALPVEWRWSLYAAVIVLVGTAINFHKVALRGRMTNVSMFMMLYGVLLIFSCLTAYNPSIAQYWGAEYAKVLLMALIASFIIERFWQIRVLSIMILLMVGYIAWEINYLYVFENRRLDVFHYGFGGLDNNGAGLMLSMGLPFAIVFVLSCKLKWQRCAAAFIALIMGHAIMMTYSRGAMLAAVVGCVWLITRHRVRSQALMAAIALTLAASVLAGPEIRTRFFSTTQFESDKSAQSRLDSWSAAWAMAWERPLTGQGIRNSGQYTHNYGADMHGRTIHSIYLQIAADSGIPAMLVYIAMLLAAFLSLRQARRMCRRELDQHALNRPPPLVEEQVRQMDMIAAAVEGSLIVFTFGAIFLSIEIFELPWLLLVLAGVFPTAVESRIKELNQSAAPESKRVKVAGAPFRRVPTFGGAPT